MSLESKEVIGLDDATETIETVNLLSTVTDLDSGIDDSISISVPKKVAMMSELIKTMIDGDNEEKNIPLPNVKPKILQKVVEYMNHHAERPPKEIEKPLRSSNMSEVVSQWDADFVDIDQETLFELVLAANYLDIKSLLDLTCAKIASMIKGKTPEAIRRTFNIVNDFTPEEEAAVLAENKWAEDS